MCAVLRADRKDWSPLFLALSHGMQSGFSAVRGREDGLNARSFETREGVFDAPPPAKRAGLWESERKALVRRHARPRTLSFSGLAALPSLSAVSSRLICSASVPRFPIFALITFSSLILASCTSFCSAFAPSLICRAPSRATRRIGRVLP